MTDFTCLLFNYLYYLTTVNLTSYSISRSPAFHQNL